MNLGAAPATYSERDQNDLRQTLDREDKRNRKLDTDVEVGGTAGPFLILRSPNGNRWKIAVSNAGALSATAL